MFCIVSEKDLKYLILDTDDMSLEYMDKKVIRHYQTIGGIQFADFRGYVVRKDRDMVFVYKVTGAVPDLLFHCVYGLSGSHGESIRLSVPYIVCPYYENGRVVVRNVISKEILYEK